MEFGGGQGCISDSNVERMSVSCGPDTKTQLTVRGLQEASLSPMGTQGRARRERNWGL